MLLRQGVKAPLPNIQKQIQGGCQIEKAKKYGPIERIEQNSQNRIKLKGDNQPIRCRVQNTDYQDAQELIEYGSSINKIQAEMKVTLSEIKKNL